LLEKNWHSFGHFQQNLNEKKQQKYNNPKIWSRSKVRIEVSIENQSCSAIQIDPKTFLNTTPIPKFGENKSKN